ncbi:calpain small subunit 1b isoform X2 [Rhincodon typus]|uniref:calpain small subunit 1b isoform X2 n=1 Tax=Rhincodon typus TaxID=259920 RepID=UPI002030885B|nr:calpain small subunit 1b isoform X2 [Rhincodon typus]XP_048474377.1 calpain small subunit 1b isoform X2 [Rhincodon typus]
MFNIAKFLGGGGGGGGLSGQLLQGLAGVIGQMVAGPAEQPRHVSQIEAYETEEERRFRAIFKQLAGDADSTGRLGFEEFKYLWDKIKKWQAVYKRFDADKSGTINSQELPLAFEAAGYPLNDELYRLLYRRYANESGDMDFDNYISCLVRLDAMLRSFKALDKDNNGSIKVNIVEWLQLTMYS